MRVIFVRGKMTGPVYLPLLSKKGFITGCHADLHLATVTSD